MSTSLGELAELVGGQLIGSAATEISGAAIIRDVRAGEITFSDNVLLAEELAESEAAAVVVPAGFDPKGIPYISVENVRESFGRIVSHFRPRHEYKLVGIHPASHVNASAKIADGVSIHGGATVGDDVEIGAGSVIHSGVHIMAGCKLAENVTVFPTAVLYEDTVVGPRVIIHAGAVLGAYGYGYDTENGRHTLGSQLGYVEIGADVEIGAGTTIDRGSYGPTTVGEGTKIDNQVMIAHNCRIGRHNLFCSQVGIAGSVTTGDYVVMAGQVGVADHVHIGDQVMLAAQTGVHRDLPAGGTYMGSPMMPIRDQMRIVATVAKLPDMRKQLRNLEKTVDKHMSTAGVKKLDAA